MPDPAVCNRCGAGKGLQAVGESCNQNCGGRVIPRPRPAAPVPPDGENPYRAVIPDEPCAHKNNGLPPEGRVPHPDSWYPCHDCGQKVARRKGGIITVAQNNAAAGENRLAVTAWDRGFAAGRAAATPDPPDMTNMCEGESPDHKPGITPAASPDERLREAGEQLANLVTLLGGYDGPGYLAAPNQGEHPDYYAAAKLFDRIMRDEKTGAAVVLAQWRAALAAADREAPDEETKR